MARRIPGPYARFVEVPDGSFDRRIDALRNAQRRAEAEKRPAAAKTFDDAARRTIAERDRRK